MEHRGKEQAAAVPKDENETYLRLAKLSSGGPAELGSVGPKMPCRYPVFSLQPPFLLWIITSRFFFSFPLFYFETKS